MRGGKYSKANASGFNFCAPGRENHGQMRLMKRPPDPIFDLGRQFDRFSCSKITQIFSL
ncbi:hypothetical protein RJ492_004400 [Pluralibacter gergoviae]|uniref:hypothetical protein n=1 Tax=Pluralibacter gergoviae TaxID=61647 RepID=UPI0028643760|nr:hypothetical protein [Pluralibacter gergoviae]ELD4297770.1 hypothetical protein [Pluralibacter gergoviae]ELD4308515.1 hypothetical protein [Pluralibacter gergoviae]ELD4333397.1 hypothetical protein [Pluralibacter gergoviae]EMB4325953.1 hypothetical protein [Pluralibacter gergoviae]